MNVSIIKISAAVPGYWENLQKPLIKMEQQAAIFEEKLQTEVSTEIAWEDVGEGKPSGMPETVSRPPCRNCVARIAGCRQEIPLIKDSIDRLPEGQRLKKLMDGD